MPWKVTSPMYQRQRFVLDAEHTPTTFTELCRRVQHQPQVRLRVARPLHPAWPRQLGRSLAPPAAVPSCHCTPENVSLARTAWAGSMNATIAFTIRRGRTERDRHLLPIT